MEDLMRSQQVENILEIAGDLFLEFGFVNKEVSDIAARSEISTASIYRAIR
jgi:AcrR family transcriptional regulator